ncbi:hypothetical protein FOA52_013044 [Chlamydomonas sp. UWO 241]|nr:hypothetical protein FOA52_013044 [Chlamydomonas sp. UWO 241]
MPGMEVPHVKEEGEQETHQVKENEEVPHAVGTSVTLQRMSQTELNGARAKVAPVPPGASAKPGRVHVKLLSPETDYEEGTVLSVPADKLVPTPLEHDTVMAIGKDEMRDFIEYVRVRQQAAAVSTAAGVPGGAAAGSRRHCDHEGHPVGTPVTLQQMRSILALNEACGLVSPLLPGSGPMQPGHVLTELVSPVAGYCEGECVSVAAEKLVCKPLEHIVADAASKHSVILDVQLGFDEYNVFYTFDDVYSLDKTFCDRVVCLLPGAVKRPKADGMHAFRRYVHARRTAEAMAVAAHMPAISMGGAYGSAGGRGGGHAPGAAPPPGRVPSRGRWPRPASGALEHSTIMQVGKYKFSNTYDQVYPLDPLYSDSVLNVRTAEVEIENFRRFVSYVRRRRQHDREAEAAQAEAEAAALAPFKTRAQARKAAGGAGS